MNPQAFPPNRLAREKSPYLLQHALNPVDWFGWGDEAFQKSRSENKPIFLSIGYSTCHWCHVMAHESFDNPVIAKLLNESFVSIKVDREERPDIDAYYMKAVMALTGSGGWPMSVFLTPEGKPFWGGTYFPPEDRWGRPGFSSILQSIQLIWKSKKERILEDADSIATALKEREAVSLQNKSELSASVLDRALEDFQSQFDPQEGGFGKAPKFPMAHVLSLLLRISSQKKNPQALQMVEETLYAMARGGIRDHLGGGFHRYSTDAEWQVPHFEKMLYDQATLLKAYLEAFQATKKEKYAEVAREIADYVLRDMSHPKGGFYSAEDADSASNPERPLEKTEGAFYLWSETELASLLSAEEKSVLYFFFQILPEGNIRHDPHGEMTKKNILQQRQSIEETAVFSKKSNEETRELLKQAKEKLFTIRAKRIRPHLDDKILTDWNGLMISSLALASRILKEPRYLISAKKSAEFLLREMKHKDGSLLHRWREGEAAIPGFLDDYAFFAHALLDLYETSGDVLFWEEALQLAHQMEKHFGASKQGYLSSRTDLPGGVESSRESQDGALPSGNAVAALVWLRLGRMSGHHDHVQHGEELLAAFSGLIQHHPTAFAQWLTAFDFLSSSGVEIVISGSRQHVDFETYLEEIYAAWIPGKIIVYAPDDQSEWRRAEKLTDLIRERRSKENSLTVYLCRNRTCNLPILSAELLKKKLLLELF